MFEHECLVKLRDTDAAGVMYFPRQYDLVHDAYQIYLDSKGFGFKFLIHEAPYMLAVVHAESDYAAPVRCGDRLTIRLRTERIGNSSYTMAYDVVDEDGKSTGTAQTVHVVFDKATRKPIPIPDDFRAALAELA
jgi:1,4-dihydroxy-2-naphthoyl-CoA hydrolase